MENYIREIIDICKLPFGEVSGDFKVIQIGTKSIYVCNFKKIIDYSLDRIVLKVNRGVLEILGRELSISQINKCEIIVKGYIQSFGVDIDDKKKK